MKIAKKYQIEKCVSKNAARYAIAPVNLMTIKGQKKAVATDGMMMAIVPAEFEDSEAGALPVDVLVAGRKAAFKKSETVDITINGAFELANGVKMPRDVTKYGTYPNVEQVIPNEPIAMKICLDPVMLLDLAKALGLNDRNNFVTISISKPADAKSNPPLMISVGPSESEGCVGILMPAKLA